MKECCKPTGFKEGVINGIIPHLGCIAFIALAAIGATTAASFIKPLLLSSVLFYALITLSLLFATISAAFYLKKDNSLSIKGIKKHTRYLSMLYGTTLLTSLLFVFVIFPSTANALSGTADLNGTEQKTTIQVGIPCSGHAFLIIDDIKQVSGVKKVQYRDPDYFDVWYDSDETSSGEIVDIKTLQLFKAKVIA